MTATTERLLYSTSRALEHAAALDDVTPLRIHPIGFPLFIAQLTATIEEHAPFDLLDRYVGLAIGDGGFRSVSGIADFLGVSEPMIDRVLRFLGGIGHLTGADGALALTERGMRSARDDQRYTAKAEKLRLYFDGVRCGPLTSAHYARGVRVMDQAHANQQRIFKLLSHSCDFRNDAVHDLARRPDRGSYDLPDELTDVAVHAVGLAFLPCYLIRARTSGGFRTLVYSAVASQRDEHVEAMVGEWPTTGRLLELGDSESPRDMFGDWLREQQISPRSIEWLDALQARLSLPASRLPSDPPANRARGMFSLTQVGSYIAPRGHVLQLWCSDPQVRRRAALARALAYASASRRATADVVGFLERVSRQLDLVPAVALDELGTYARATGHGSLILT
ncbi:hypothetical protein GT755_01880 [Herbidospora sp. NEAU-GS84]|uniref:Uncharacterized protein n=1 Tax=Herbidospora solisilvae TaxID=2696284 RepID=A0A7C9MUC7_9ACTN|nr:hypothetical protein [Herbidospora solisilvae]NAS20431.1 hypothetical protein [Herbidospora solisilvae]